MFIVACHSCTDECWNPSMHVYMPLMVIYIWSSDDVRVNASIFLHISRRFEVNSVWVGLALSCRVSDMNRLPTTCGWHYSNHTSSTSSRDGFSCIRTGRRTTRTRERESPRSRWSFHHLYAFVFEGGYRQYNTRIVYNYQFYEWICNTLNTLGQKSLVVTRIFISDVCDFWLPPVSYSEIHTTVLVQWSKLPNWNLFISPRVAGWYVNGRTLNTPTKNRADLTAFTRDLLVFSEALSACVRFCEPVCVWVCQNCAEQQPFEPPAGGDVGSKLELEPRGSFISFTGQVLGTKCVHVNLFNFFRITIGHWGQWMSCVFMFKSIHM